MSSNKERLRYVLEALEAKAKLGLDQVQPSGLPARVFERRGRVVMVHARGWYGFPYFDRKKPTNAQIDTLEKMLDTFEFDPCEYCVGWTDRTDTCSRSAAIRLGTILLDGRGTRARTAEM